MKNQLHNKYTFCSIITADYFFYIKALYDSLEKFYDDLTFNLLIVDQSSGVFGYKGIEINTLKNIKAAFPEKFNLIEKYETDIKSNFRWALKPLFLNYLLSESDFEKVLFLDPDLFFYNNPSFLFEGLDTHSIMITPHWRSKNPLRDKSNFDILFTQGIYNAGFFGCNKSSINILDWWLEVCAYKMEKSNGFYVDQGYLNLMPIYFSDQVKMIEHKGCNVSNWNKIECERTVNEKSEILINNKYPIVFIHFTNATINQIHSGNDKLLLPFLDIYKSTLLKHCPDFKFSYEKKEFTENKSLLIILKNKFFR